MNFGSRPPAVPWAPRSLLKARLRPRSEMMEWLSSFDMVWDTRSGDSFADIYGMARHRTMSLIHEFAAQAGTRVFMAPQTIGPFHHLEAKFLARRNLRRSRLVFARDRASADASARLGRTVDMTATDMVFALPQPESTEPRDVLVNVSGLLWTENNHVDSSKYRTIVRAVIRNLLESNRQVTLLAHVLDSANPDNDVPAIESLLHEWGDDIDAYIPTGLDDARRVIGSSAVVVGARMHACLNALSTGVPAIPLAYSRKFAPLLQSLGWEHVVSLNDSADPVKSVLSALAHSALSDEALAVHDHGRRLIVETIPTISASA